MDGGWGALVSVGVSGGGNMTRRVQSKEKQQHCRWWIECLVAVALFLFFFWGGGLSITSPLRIKKQHEAAAAVVPPLLLADDDTSPPAERPNDPQSPTLQPAAFERLYNGRIRSSMTASGASSCAGWVDPCWPAAAGLDRRRSSTDHRHSESMMMMMMTPNDDDDDDGVMFEMLHCVPKN